MGKMLKEQQKMVLYKCVGMDDINNGSPYFWWFDNGFHYEVDRWKYHEATGLVGDEIPEWGAICNLETEEYIKKNCTPPFPEVLQKECHKCVEAA